MPGPRLRLLLLALLAGMLTAILATASAPETGPTPGPAGPPAAAADPVPAGAPDADPAAAMDDASPPDQAARVEVTVMGVADEEWDRNVKALLGIYQEQRDDTLTVVRLRALHRRAPEQIREALAPFGLYRVEIEDALTPPAAPGGPWLARYQITPGPQVKVASVAYQITGPGADNPAFPTTFGMQVGEVLLHLVYEQARNEVTAIASEQGFLDAQLVRHVVLIDLESYEAFVEVHLDTGPRFFIGRITFEQDLLADRFLQRFVTFTPGTPYDPGLLLALQGRLLGTEYFRRVEIVPLTQQADANRVVPIVVRAERNKANKYRVGLGFATDVGPRLSFDYQRRYIGRFGHRASADLELSQASQSLTAEYRIPIRNPVQDSFLLRFNANASDTASVKGDSLRLSAAQSILTRRGWRRNLGVDYRYENYEVGSDTGTFNGLVPHISWAKVRADDVINTRNGFRLRYLVQGTSEGILAETSWLSGSVSYKWIKSLGEDTRLITRTDLGATLAQDIRDVPGSDRFFAGGDQSLRGFGFNALGPIDPETGEVIGGRYLATGSLELDRRIAGNWSGAVFTDFGNAFDPDFTDEWQQSAGIGVRYATPIGPVRVDLAYALTKDEPGFRLHFGLGPDL